MEHAHRKGLPQTKRGLGNLIANRVKTMNVLPEALEKLTSRVDALEKRVHDLEHPSEAFASSATQVSNLPPAPEITEESPIEQVGSVFPVLGGAMLGIAGAYVLRALAESGLVPPTADAAVAIVYAVAWLVWSVKARATTPFARAIYAGTSALIWRLCCGNSSCASISSLPCSPL